MKAGQSAIGVEKVAANVSIRNHQQPKDLQLKAPRQKMELLLNSKPARILPTMLKTGRTTQSPSV